MAVEVNRRGWVNFGGKSLDWRHSPKKATLVRFLSDRGKADIRELILEVDKVDFSNASPRMEESLRTNMTKLLQRSRDELAGAFGGSWLVYHKGVYWLNATHMEVPEMADGGGFNSSLGEASQTERAEESALPIGNLPPKQKEAWLDVETYRRNNPQASISLAFTATGVNPNNYYLAKKKLEGNGGMFSIRKGDLIRKDSPIVKAMAKAVADELDEIEDFDPEDLRVPDEPTDPDDRPELPPFLREFEREKHQVEPSGYMSPTMEPRDIKRMRSIDPDAIRREQIEFARKQLTVAPHAEELIKEIEASELEPADGPDPDQVLGEVLAWLRQLNATDQKRVTMAAQVMLGIL